MQRTRTIGLIVMLVALALDQLSKMLIIDTMTSPDHNVLEFLPFFNIVLVWNYGISFGMFAASKQTFLLSGVSVIITLILLGWLWRNTSMLTAVALGFIMGGAIGNVIDRLRFGAVVDFLDVHMGNYHWPAFNVADSSIFIGVVLLCGSSMFSKTP